MRLALLLTALALALSTSTAFAQVAAARESALAPRRDAPHPPAGLGGGFAVGNVEAAGLEDGRVVRLEYEVLPVLAPRGTVGAFFGFTSGFQAWRAGDDWGAGFPVAMTLGVRGPGVRAGALVGFEAMLLDRVAGDHGFGMYAPLAGARITVGDGPITAGADARVTRRWQLGAPDHTQWQLALVVGYTWETRLRAPIR